MPFIILSCSIFLTSSTSTGTYFKINFRHTDPFLSYKYPHFPCLGCRSASRTNLLFAGPTIPLGRKILFIDFSITYFDISCNDIESWVNEAKTGLDYKMLSIDLDFVLFPLYDLSLSSLAVRQFLPSI